MTEQRNTKLVNCGAMWKPKNAGGKVLLSGTVDLADGSKLRIKMFKNDHKKEDRHPDYRLVKEVEIGGPDDPDAGGI